MAITVAINGFGRIGRNVMRVAAKHPDINVVAINDLADLQQMAHLFTYDSNFGKYQGSISTQEQALIIDGKKIHYYSERDPEQLPWAKLGVDVVIESTGFFTKREGATKHLTAGAKKVIISAPAKQPDITVVLGVNHTALDKANHNIISNASCTTNCLAPVIKVLHDSFAVKRALMTTTHSYTLDQRILDSLHPSDLRRTRSAALSMIPTTTGAAAAVGEVLPELKGKIHGLAVRVPTPTVSLVDVVAEVGRDVSAEQVNEALRTAAQGALKGYLDVCDEELVSIDFKQNTASSIVDAPSTIVTEGNLVKVLSWYDNEWGYSNRIVDLILFLFAE